MAPGFSITVDPARHLMRVRLSGFFTPELAAEFVAARDEAQAKLRCGPNQRAAVVDLRDLRIQPQDVVARFQSLLADHSKRSGRLAVVTSSTLSRLQVNRAAGHHGVDVRFFADLDEAEAWATGSGPTA